MHEFNQVVPDSPGIRFATTDRPALIVTDPVEQDRITILTGDPVNPTPTDTTGFGVPVDAAVEVSPAYIDILVGVGAHVRTSDGELVETVEYPLSEPWTGAGKYVIEMGGSVMKCYLKVYGGQLTIRETRRSAGGVVVDCSPSTTVAVGVRSRNDQPARTLETTGEPVDLMRAVSRFGVAMKSWGPNRSYPTLRGHPPLLEVVDIPDRSEVPAPPETGITLTVPPERGLVCTAAPLAYWLGATVRPGPPALHLDGYRYPLSPPASVGSAEWIRGVEQRIANTLRATFRCEVAARDWYDEELQLEQHMDRLGVSLAFDTLSDRPIANRTRAYLQADVSVQQLAEEISTPRWPSEAYIEATSDHLPALPFLIRDLAIIRRADTADIERLHDIDVIDPETAAVSENDDSVLLSAPAVHYETASSEPLVARVSASAESNGQPAPQTPLVSLPSTDTISPIWVGDGVAIGATTATVAGYYHRLTTKGMASDTAALNVEIVLNDDQMAAEAAAAGRYSGGDQLPFDVTVSEPQSRHELAEVFEQDADFLHYIGHVDAAGFRCSDGHLDAANLDVGATAFILNGCQSYEQGQRLIENGATTGIVTLSDVLSPFAAQVGLTAAQLFNSGVSISAAAKLIRQTETSGQHYTVLGDAKIGLIDGPQGSNELMIVSLTDDDRIQIAQESTGIAGFGLGSNHIPWHSGPNWVNPGGQSGIQFDDDEQAIEYISDDQRPVVVDDEIFWSDELTAEEIRACFSES